MENIFKENSNYKTANRTWPQSRVNSRIPSGSRKFFGKYLKMTEVSDSYFLLSEQKGFTKTNNQEKEASPGRTLRMVQKQGEKKGQAPPPSIQLCQQPCEVSASVW